MMSVDTFTSVSFSKANQNVGFGWVNGRAISNVDCKTGMVNARARHSATANKLHFLQELNDFFFFPVGVCPQRKHPESPFSQFFAPFFLRLFLARSVKSPPPKTEGALNTDVEGSSVGQEGFLLPAPFPSFRSHSEIAPLGVRKWCVQLRWPQCPALSYNILH